jgi:hypothetical protein
MPFTFLYSQHWEVGEASKVFRKIFIEPDGDRGGKGSGIVSFWRKGGVGLYLCTTLNHFPIEKKLLLKLSWIRKG